ncbi:hypothetical protein K3495_g7487 [Podosphaera aphanis]|nr:hypothetical protein K3495_g7487 [Podosphaera aphanis]
MRPVAKKDKATRYDEKFNLARNYSADINENDQIEMSNNEPNNQEMEHNLCKEVYLHRMDNSSDQESISDNRPEHVEWSNPAYNYHFTNFQKPGIDRVDCEICAASFSSHNRLHQYIRFLHSKTPAKASKLLSPLTTNSSLHVFHRFDTIQPSLQVVTSKAPENLLHPGYGLKTVDMHRLRKFLLQACPAIKLFIMPTPMTVRGIGNQVHDASHFAKLDIFFPDGKGNAGHIKRELHVVDNLPAKILLGIDIMTPAGWSVDFDSKTLSLPHGANIQVPIITRSKVPESSTAQIFTKQRLTVPPHSRSLVPILGKNGAPLELPDCDLIFQPKQNPTLTTFAHLVSKHTNKILVQNNTSESYSLLENALLGEVIDVEVDNVIEISPEAIFFSELAPPLSPIRPQCKEALAYHTSIKTLIHSASRNELVTKCGVTIYGDTYQRSKLEKLLSRYCSLWEKPSNNSFAKTPSGNDMPIPLIDGWEAKYKPGQARIYPVGKLDRNLIDKTFNELHEQGRLTWTKGHTPFSFP